MKATKIIALVLILGIASIGFAQQDRPAEQTPYTQPKSIVMQLDKALRNPALVKAMYLQLNPRFLNVDQPRYTVGVRYDHKVLYINGSYEQWIAFFRIDMNDDPQGKLKPEITLKRALAIPMLARAMRAQLTPDFLKLDKPSYTVPVRYKHSITYVTGSQEDWMWFFRIKSKVKPTR